MTRHTVFHIQHFVYPWRFPVFSELANHIELAVFFCRAKRRFRHWDTTIPSDQGFRGKILSAIYIGPLTFNPGLIKELWKPYDVYSVAALDRVNLLQFITTLVVAKVRRKPFILVDEFIVSDYYRSRRRIAYNINRMIRRIVYPHVDAFVLWNDLARNFLETLRVPPHKIFSGPQVLSEQDAVFRRKPGEQCANDILADGDTVRILFVGNLVETKGTAVLIDAFRGLNEKDIRLEIVGDGPLRERLAALSGKDERVRIHGHLMGTAKRELFRTSHIFVLPSLHEPWGFVINEALEWGLPVITTDAVGAAGYLAKANGLIVPAGDVHALRSAISALIHDHAAIRAMSHASRDLAAQLTIRDMAKPFLDAVNSVCFD